MAKKKTKTKTKTYTTKKKNKEKLLKALEQHKGIVTHACDMIGLSRQTYYKYYEEDEEFAEAVDSIGEFVLDFVESKNLENITNGNVQSIIFYLKTKGKHRGFIEKTEQDINHNVEQIQIKPYIKDDEEDKDKD